MDLVVWSVEVIWDFYGGKTVWGVIYWGCVGVGNKSMCWSEFVLEDLEGLRIEGSGLIYSIGFPF